MKRATKTWPCLTFRATMNVYNYWLWTDDKIENLRNELNKVQEQSIQIRERKASSGATIEGLNKRKSDLLDRINSELNLNEENILEYSNLNGVEDLPNPVDQEDALDKKKQERERLGSVNLKANEETTKNKEIR